MNMNKEIQIHFGYVIFNEGTKRQQVRVLIAASEEGLEAQAMLLKERLRGEDYISNVDDLDYYDEECIVEINEQRA
jgi:hypothetical protein